MSNTREATRDLNKYFTDSEITGAAPDSADLAARYAEKRKRLAETFGSDKVTISSPGHLVTLEPLHKLIIAMYITGDFSVAKLARELGLAYTFVWKTLQDPLAKEVLNEWKQTLELELESLYPLAIDAVRAGLKSSDRKTALLAVDRFERLMGGETPEGTKGGTTINIINEGRVKFISALKEKAEKHKVIEAKVVHVTNDDFEI